MFSYHNHSNFSDGHTEAEEMIVAAYNNGIKEFGLSDHFAIYPFNDEYYGLKDIDKYVNTVKTLKECYAHKLVVRLGIELDYFSETDIEAHEILSKYPIDYIIGGNHYIENWGFDYSKEEWLDLGSNGIDNKITQYWEKEFQMIKNSDIDIVAHIDLYNKWGELNNKDYTDYFVECLKIIKDKEIVLEMNTAKKTNIPQDYYPNNKFMEIISEYNIPMIISSDAHYPVHVTRNFDLAEKLFLKYKIKYTAKFENRKKNFIEIGK